MLDKEADDELYELRNKPEYERSRGFYQCHGQCVLFEVAAEQGFRCEDCESKFEHCDTGVLIKELEEQIEEREKARRRD
ncbi:MAG: hypothetical protein ACP5E9_06520 [Candidatus Methanospirareceae archaeon]